MHSNTRRALLAGPLFLIFCVGLWSRPGLRARAADPSVRLGKQEVSAEIDDGRGIAVTTIRQELLNSGGDESDASCDLPIPDDAALLRYQVLAPAPRRREPAASRGGVEAVGRNLYRATIHRVPGRGRGLFELTYAEAVTRRG